MKRYEIYLDNDNRVSIDCFRDLNQEYPSSFLKERETYNLINLLSKQKIISINETKEDISIKCNNCIININEYNLLLTKQGLGPIINLLKKYIELEQIKKQNKRKVKRTNKHSGKKIIATGLALLAIGSCVFALNNKDYTPVSNFSSQIEINNDLERDKSLENLIFKKENNNENIIYLEYEDRSDSEKAKITEAYYGNVLKKYSKIYGIDYNIILAIATQERGIHSTNMDRGGATGLMQIQNSVWIGESVTAYNYETKQYESFKVDKNSISDVFSNIKIGCMIFQNCMNYMDNNVFAAIQCYNMGCGSMNKILNIYSKESNKTKNNILKDQKDIGWLPYREFIKMGDPHYLENVLSWIGKEATLTNKKVSGGNIVLNISNKGNKKIY